MAVGKWFSQILVIPSMQSITTGVAATTRQIKLNRIAEKRFFKHKYKFL